LAFYFHILSLSILSRKVFTECRCQRHVKPPTPATRCPLRLKRRERTPAAEGGTMGEKFPRNLPKVATSTPLLGSFTCCKFTAWDRRLYFPSEGRRAEDFFAQKIQRLRPGLNPPARLPLDHRSRYSQNMQKLILFYCHNDCANAPQCHVLHTLPAFILIHEALSAVKPFGTWLCVGGQAVAHVTKYYLT